MGDWTVALILLGLSAVILVAVGLICRFMGIFRLNSLFASGEEKTILTKPNGHNGYMVSALLSYSIMGPIIVSFCRVVM